MLRRRGRALPGPVVVGVLVIVAGLTTAVVVPVVGTPPGGPPEPQPEVPVTPMNLIERPAFNSPTVAVDPTEDRFVVVANRRDAPFDCGLQLSGNGGRSWVTAAPVPKLPPGADTCYGPEIAFDRDGLLYFLFVGLAGPGNSPMGVFLTTSGDRGRTFSDPRRVLGPERYQVRMALDPTAGRNGRIHLVWLEATSDPPLGGLPSPPNPIMAAYSDDGGRRFSRPAQISDPARERVVAPALAVGPDRAVHVLYYDLGDDVRDYQGLEGPPWEGTWTLVATSSNDGGRRFGPGVVVDDEIAPPGRVMLIFTMRPPALAAGEDGWLYASWYDNRNGDWDVFVRRSPDGGRTWKPPLRINDDRVANRRHQYLPRVSVAPDGRVDAIFYDRRGNVENRGNDVYYTYSRDHGATFEPNIKLTALDSDSTIGPRYLVPSAAGLIEFGSRLGLISKRGEAIAAWTDTRNTGRGAPSQEVFAAEIRFPDATAPGWARPAGIVLTLVGIALLASRYRRPPKMAADVSPVEPG